MMWRVHDKVSVSKEFDETQYTSLSSRNIEIDNLEMLLDLIKPKGRAIIIYEEEQGFDLVLVDPRCDVKRD